VLRFIFGPQRDEVAGRLRKLHNGELSGLYYSPSIGRIIKSRRMRWAWHVARMSEGGLYVGKLLGKVRLGRSRRRWVDNVKTDLLERG
jgi:hypothetical protein